MEKEEDVYNWYEIKNSTMRSLNGGTIHFLNVTSQRWLDKTKAYGPSGDNIWSHHVAINIPKNLTFTHHAASYLTGGCNAKGDGSLPSNTDEDILVADEFARLANMVVITVFQIPNCKIIYPSDPEKRPR